jgi:hypothetical protein
LAERGITKANARVLSEKGVRAAREAREAVKADPSLKVSRALPRLFDALLAAAEGKGEWKELPVDKRLQALFKAIEYGAGKPIGRDKTLEPAPAGEGDGVEQAGGLTVV